MPFRFRWWKKKQLHCEWIWSSSESSEIRWVTDDMCSRLTDMTQSLWRLLVPNPFRLWGQILRTFGKQENEISRNAGGPRSRSVGRCRRGTCRWRHCVRPAKGTVSGVGEGLFIQRDEFRFLSPRTFRHLVTTPKHTPTPLTTQGMKMHGFKAYWFTFYRFYTTRRSYYIFGRVFSHTTEPTFNTVCE